MYDLARHVIFTHPPKCAGTTIEVAFGWHPGHNRDTLQSLKNSYFGDCGMHEEELFQKFKHARLDQHIEHLNIFNLDYSKFFKFTCIRNPWDIAVSRYFFNQKNNAIVKNKDFRHMSFSEYLQFRCVKQDTTSSKFLNLKFFTHYKDKYEMDFVVRYENYREDFEELIKLFGVKYPTQKYNSNTRKDSERDYRKFYKNDKDIQLVAEAASDSIARFGYTF